MGGLECPPSPALQAGISPLLPSPSTGRLTLLPSPSTAHHYPHLCGAECEERRNVGLGQFGDGIEVWVVSNGVIFGGRRSGGAHGI